MGAFMRRREFIGLVGGAAAWPLAARAQQPERVRRIVVFPLGAESDPEAQAYVSALRQGLEKLGWINGQNIRVDHRWITGDVGRMRADVAEAVALAPDVIVSGGTQVTGELQKNSRAIPTIFVQVADPLAAGLVQSLARPGGNVTGFSAYEASMAGKWLELLKEIVPRISQVLVLVDQQSPTWKLHVPAIMAAAPSFAVQVTTTHVNNPAEIERAIDAFGGTRDAGVIVLPGILNQTHRELIIARVMTHRMPAIYAFRSYVISGGLAYYGFDFVDSYRRAASYVDRILKGASPADLPVQQPTKFELAINLKTAKALGITIPPTLLARADEVIE
jgi:putative ABC transport system substrate-binding protein